MSFNDIKIQLSPELEKLKIEAMQFKGIEVKDYGNCNVSIYISLDSEFRARIGFEFTECRTKFDLKYYLEFEQLIEDEYDDYRISIVPKKHLMPEEILAIGKYRDSRYNIEHGSTICEAGIDVIKKVLRDKQKLIDMCVASTCWNSDGSLKYNLKDWKTDAQLIKIEKEVPIARMAIGIKKDRQPLYDGAYGIHGSNGTYVENVNPEWVLFFRVKRLGIEVDNPETLCVNIHDYIRTKLMPRLDWGKITEQRLELLNNLIHGKKLKVITTDMDKAPIYRNFKPIEKGWEEVLDNLFQNLLNG